MTGVVKSSGKEIGGKPEKKRYSWSGILNCFTFLELPSFEPMEMKQKRCEVQKGHCLPMLAKCKFIVGGGISWQRYFWYDSFLKIR